MKRPGIVFIALVLATLALVYLLFRLSSSASFSFQANDSDPLVLYCAAGIKPPVEKIVHDYQAQYGVEVQLQYGGSGTLLSNLKVARQGDLYLAADESYLLMARTNHLVREILPIARMRPVVAVAKGNPKAIQSVDDLLRDDVKVALASPEAAAVGTVTRKLLSASGHWTALEQKAAVTKPTVMEVANDLKIGTVDAGIIWDATVNHYPELEGIAIPELENGSRLISIGVLESCKQPAAALHFARYLTSRTKGLPVFEGLGYNPIRGDAWSETPEVVLFSGGVNRMAIDDTLNAFEQREGVNVTRVYNGCGILVAQMKAGENPDAYFACDVSFMTEVNDLFGESEDLSQTDMVILAQKGNPKSLQSLGDLAKPGLKIGVANPQQSALGKLTENLLVSMDLLEAVMKNVIAQTPTADLLVNQLRAGSLDAVIVYRANTSQVVDSTEAITILHEKAGAIQPYAISRNSDHAWLMGRLLDALKAEQSKQRFQDVGFKWMAESP